MKFQNENCPKCNYPDGPGNNRYKGIYTAGKTCSGCGYQEKRTMKKIDVSERVGTVLLSEGSGKDLFIAVMEAYLEGDRDDDIELDFSDVMTIGPDAMDAFVDTAAESKQCSLDLLRTRLHFSGVLINDVHTISKSFTDGRKNIPDERQANFEDLMSKMKEGMGGGKDFPLGKIFEAVQGTSLTSEGLEASMRQLDTLLKGINRK